MTNTILRIREQEKECSKKIYYLEHFWHRTEVNLKQEVRPQRIDYSCEGKAAHNSEYWDDEKTTHLQGKSLYPG